MHKNRRSGPPCPACKGTFWKTRRKDAHVFQCRVCGQLVQNVTNEAGEVFVFPLKLSESQ